MAKALRGISRSVLLKFIRLEDRLTPAPIVPPYNSNPGAPAELFLDFDGNFELGPWCGGAYFAINSTAFSTDADYNNFSSAELSTIEQIWKRVAEDYAPFNINVTTVQPADFNDKHAMRISIGDHSGGAPLTWNFGGVACLGSFYNSNPNVVYVVPKNLSNNAKYIALASSHEGGHSFGLAHQKAKNGGSSCQEYHDGDTYNGESKGPLMGAPWNATRELWWKGFEGCGTQDDLLVLSNSTNGFGYRADDHSNVFSDETRLRNNLGVLAGKTTGIITTTSDVDVFSFGSPAGSVSITVNPAALGPNFDAILELYHDVGGTPVLLATADPSGNTSSATITFDVPVGKKYLVVKSDGDYGEVGVYSITGTVPSSGSFPEGGEDGVITFDHPLAPLFVGSDASSNNSDSTPYFGCGCPQCMAAVNGVRSDAVIQALATVKPPSLLELQGMKPFSGSAASRPMPGHELASDEAAAVVETESSVTAATPIRHELNPVETFDLEWLPGEIVATL